MKNNKIKGLIVLIAIFVIAALISVFETSGKGQTNRNSFTPAENISFNTVKKGKNGYIAKLYIEGVIQKENQVYNQDWLLSTITKLKQDNKNKGIALIINSPGGSVYEADQVYLALQDYKTSGKPVYAYQTNLAASGGYYISCAAKKIYANRNTLTGSIGVITGSTFDMTEFLAKHGIKSRTIHAGKNKNMFNYNEPVTQEQIDIMQSIADECYDQFTGIVAMNRNIPHYQVCKLADGRIYTANQALKNGLIDSVSDFSSMLLDMKEAEFNGKDLNTIDFKYHRNQNFRDMLMGSIFGNTTLSAFDSFISKQQVQYPAFLYE